MDRHAVLYAELVGARRRALKWERIEYIEDLTYTVINLKPDTPYQFRVRAYPLEGVEAGAAETDSITVRTRADEPHDWAGLSFQPQRSLPTFPNSLTYPCIEAYGGKLYVLEAVGEKLWLSRINPVPRDARRRGLPNDDASELEWTRDITPRTDDPPAWCMHPDLCVFDDKLWITWHVRRATASESSPGELRQRLMFYDLAGSDEDGAPDMRSRRSSACGDGAAYEHRLSAPLEIHPSVRSRSTCFGSVASFREALWIQWTETWADEAGGRRAVILLGVYDPQHGQIVSRAQWYDCPSSCPERPSVCVFEGALLVFFSDCEAREGSTDGGDLSCARFDGKRFYGVQKLRGLGTNLGARGVYMQDRFYFVYQSDAQYLAAGGMYNDIAIGRLGSRGLTLETVEYVTDMKYNSTPDIAVLENALFAVCAKRDQAPDMGSTPPRAFGTYLSKITMTTEQTKP